jgi:hypothetical protein
MVLMGPIWLITLPLIGFAIKKEKIIKFVLMPTPSILYLFSMTPPFTMIGSSVAIVEESKHQDFPQGEKNSFRFFNSAH